MDAALKVKHRNLFTEESIIFYGRVMKTYLQNLRKKSVAVIAVHLAFCTVEKSSTDLLKYLRGSTENF